MTYQIITHDTHRSVRHRRIHGPSHHGAVMEAVARRYRLGAGHRIEVTTVHVPSEPTHGRYFVYVEGYYEPLHQGSYVATRIGA